MHGNMVCHVAADFLLGVRLARVVHVTLEAEIGGMDADNMA